ncbi:protein AMEIOTIC 1 homolog isoform X2 [Triticum dicoccoides]|uniref:protein AMEIOTIC 1 homolog isoform X2 n=1 Tax=Triticum dicoccoides TaxID=85692 RepID=UPI001891BFD3|nr:protein AMEIOTIC 1 homolog isoform X2 [Triticum dicoccoides]XP_044434036.1 protein AMEIOTIC 1 homolog isoform X2 [Triticum aestivum]
MVEARRSRVRGRLHAQGKGAGGGAHQGARRSKKSVKAHQGTMNNEGKSEAVKAYISHETYQDKYECVLKANGNLEKQVLSLEEKYANATRANGKLEEEVLFLKEKYEAMLEKNTRLEGHVAALSTSFLSLKEGMQFLNDGDQQLQIMGAEPRLSSVCQGVLQS